MARRAKHHSGDFGPRSRQVHLGIRLNLPAVAYHEALDGRWPDLEPLARLGEVVCWRCRRPLRSCGPNRNGRHLNGTAAKWNAGHVRRADPLSPIVPECSPCNLRDGGEHGARSADANRTSRDW